MSSSQQYFPENYRIVVHSRAIQGRVYLTAVNFDFGIEHHEEVTRFSESERILSIAHLILGIQKKIAERLKSLGRNAQPHPTPMNAAEVLQPKLDQSLSIGDTAALLGEKIHTVRRMADQGLLPFHTSVGGHRRFSRETMIRLAQERALRSDSK